MLLEIVMQLFQQLNGKNIIKLDWGEISSLMKTPGWVFDTRLIVDEEGVINSGLSFWRVGVGTVKRG